MNYTQWLIFSLHFRHIWLLFVSADGSTRPSPSLPFPIPQKGKQGKGTRTAMTRTRLEHRRRRQMSMGNAAFRRPSSALGSLFFSFFFRLGSCQASLASLGWVSFRGSAVGFGSAALALSLSCLVPCPSDKCACLRSLVVDSWIPHAPPPFLLHIAIRRSLAPSTQSFFHLCSPATAILLSLSPPLSRRVCASSQPTTAHYIPT